MLNKEKARQVAYGRNNVLSCLEAGIVLEVFVLDGFKDDKIDKFISSLKLNKTYVQKKVLNDMAGGNHQGIVAIVKTFEYSLLEELLIDAKKAQNPIILVLDEINDPHNLGAIIRTAEALGVTGIILKKDRQVAVTPTVMKVATGAQNQLKIVQVTNLTQALEKLKKAGFWVVSTSLESQKYVHELKYDFPLVVIMGNEHKGVSHLLNKNADFIVKIPMLGTTNSLNVSVATGVMLALIRQIQLYL